jgi:VIT1/CCC1 family predicted Fe2+/Mn2+ transporter
MKKKKKKEFLERFDIAWFNAFIYSLGIIWATGAIAGILSFFMTLSELITSLIYLVIWVGLLFFADLLLSENKFKKMVRYASLIFLVIYIIGVILKLLK